MGRALTKRRLFPAKGARFRGRRAPFAAMQPRRIAAYAGFANAELVWSVIRDSQRERL